MKAHYEQYMQKRVNREKIVFAYNKKSDIIKNINMYYYAVLRSIGQKWRGKNYEESRRLCKNHP